MSHPYSDPTGSGLTSTPSQRLMNADALRVRRGGQGMSGGDADSGTPLGDLGGSLSDVLYPAGYGRPQKQPVVSDADPPQQGVVSDGNDMYHVRNASNGPTVTPVGPSGALQDEDAP